MHARCTSESDMSTGNSRILTARHLKKFERSETTSIVAWRHSRKNCSNLLSSFVAEREHLFPDPATSVRQAGEELMQEWIHILRSHDNFITTTTRPLHIHSP